jgi:hypothetical protein
MRILSKQPIKKGDARMKRKKLLVIALLVFFFSAILVPSALFEKIHPEKACTSVS